MSDVRTDYRQSVSSLGKKEFTLLKMQEYGFWPAHLPTPYERQKNETDEQYNERKKLLAKYDKTIEQIDKLYAEKDEINKKLRELQKKYDQTWDYEKIRQDVAKTIMQESIARRAERKQQRELAKLEKSKAWQAHKAESIVFLGKGCSGSMQQRETDESKLKGLGLPILRDDREIAAFLQVDYKTLRSLCYHRDVITFDNYHRFTIAKKKGGQRTIAAPKPLLKQAQKTILTEMLAKLAVENCCHGFVQSKSVLSNASTHSTQPQLLLNIDLEDFFATITLPRVIGMFKNFGYSGYVASILAMLCTYCERMPMQIRDETKLVSTSPRILPQGAPSSPMITNIICNRLDKRLCSLAQKHGAKYSRYADDMSFSFQQTGGLEAGKFMGLINAIVQDEGLKVNRSKTRFLRPNNCQNITGIVINNEQPGVPKNWLRNLRAGLHNVAKARLHGEKIEPKKLNELAGMLSWLKNVNPERYKSFLEKADKIIT